jgi:hypothetical protein
MSEEQAVEQTDARTSFEDKFLGVRHKINTKQSETEETQPEFDLEVVDDRPPEDRRPPKKEVLSKEDDDEELEGYSEKVKKRINKLKYEQHEERRQREAAEKMREEAVKVAQQYAAQNQQYQHVIQNGEAMLVTQIKDRAALAVEQAKSKYKEAYESGDTEKVIEAQDTLLNASSELREANNYEAQFNQKKQQYDQYVQSMGQQPQQPAQQPAQQQAPQPSEQALRWAKENPWFGSEDHKDMTALAYGVHEKLVKNEGFHPESDEYFQEIDRTMRAKFPEYFGEEDGQQVQTPSPSRRNSMVVAPASRNNGAKPRKVKLTHTQIALAKRLGLTNEQYAKQLIQEELR